MVSTVDHTLVECTDGLKLLQKMIGSDFPARSISWYFGS